ncbi:MAG: nucleotidyl transferase AbiEii/AbiGii toxin family protein [Spirochaetes bacterium]|nr:nucleotidyl transferase AbiEii/AbiGii toxin family protein [Spirochaetota bacterium]
MSREATRNIPASIRQRLLDKSRSDGRPFNEILQYFAMERFLFRLSQSTYANRFVLKGAMMLSVWKAVEARSTKGIDFLGKVDNAEESIKEAIIGILAIPAPEDGILFDAATIATSRITEDADYQGIRVTFRAQLDTARINMKLDIGFGDVVFPQPERLAFPTMLALPGPELLCYSRESAIAEKCQAMVKLGSLNSRMKDFFDIWLLSRQFDFEAVTLRESLRLTFEKRGTGLAGLSVFPKDFAEAKQLQWKAFRSRLKLDHAPELFSAVLDHLAVFLGPCVLLDRGVNPVDLKWIAPGPWIDSKGLA